MRNKDLRIVVDTFKYYYKSVTKNESYRFKMSDGRMTSILKFIDIFKSEYGTNFVQKDYLKMYMEFQFNYWYKQDAKYGQGTSIQIEWIIGKKAWKRWNSRTEKHKQVTSHIVRKNFKSDVKLKSDKKHNEGWAKTMLHIKDVEEFEKEMFFNSAKGFVNCSINTTLFNHKSILCFRCKYKAKCKEELKNTYPNVYKIREY